MRICPKCNQRFPDDARVCPHDGQRLVDESATGGGTGGQPMPDTHEDFAVADTVVAEADGSTQTASRQSTASTPTNRQSPPDVTKSRDSKNTSGSNSQHSTNIPMDTSDLIGERIFGEYTIAEKLGEGGMGAVYLAEQDSIDQKIAVKVLHEEAAEDHEMVQRFHREARVVSMLTHPNIIRVFIFGRTPGGLLYLAMEYVDGTPLRDVIDRGLMDELRVIKILKQLCSALSEAHDFGIIHRDLKPDNVLMTEWRGEQDFAKILDFGIAKLKQPDEQAEQKKLTQAGVVYGTPEYLSPEQAQALDLDNRTDLYSLGCILYEMMTGYLPFSSEQPVKIMTAHVYEDPTPPSELAPDRVSPTMENIILKAMAKEPDDRFQDGMEMFEALVAREREITMEKDLDEPGAYVPGMEMTGMFSAVNLDDSDLPEKTTPGSSNTQPTRSNQNETAEASRPAGMNRSMTTTNSQKTKSDSQDTIRLVIYLLIAGTALLFIVLLAVIGFAFLR